MRIPSKQQALGMLEEAGTVNPGEWIGHSYNVAKAAETISSFCPGMNPEYFFILGLLHDIGRKDGIKDVRHAYDGYVFLNSLGFDHTAMICLTHAYPTGEIDLVIGKNDLTVQENDLVASIVHNHTYDDYDRLIHLCDMLSYPEGFVILEKRLVDIGMRKGLESHHLKWWKSSFGCKKYFEKMAGKNLYDILPDVKENTFKL